MKTSIKLFFILLLSLMFTVPGVVLCEAGKWPERPIKIVVSYAVGGGTDRQFRAFASFLEPILTVPVVVENRGGAQQKNSTAYFLNHPSAKEGYMFLAMSGCGEPIRAIAAVNPNRDIVKPIMNPSEENWMLVVHKDSKIRSFKDFVTTAQKMGNTFRVGISGGAIGEIWFAWVKEVSGPLKLDIRTVNYQGGGPTISAALGNHDHAYVTTCANWAPHLKAGTLFPLAVTTAERMAHLPDIPTLMESAKKMGADKISPPPSSRKLFFAHGNVDDAIVIKMEAAMKKLFDPSGDFMKYASKMPDKNDFKYFTREQAISSYYDIWSRFVGPAKP